MYSCTTAACHSGQVTIEMKFTARPIFVIAEPRECSRNIDPCADRQCPPPNQVSPFAFRSCNADLAMFGGVTSLPSTRLYTRVKESLVTPVKETIVTPVYSKLKDELGDIRDVVQTGGEWAGTLQPHAPPIMSMTLAHQRSHARHLSLGHTRQPA